MVKRQGQGQLKLKSPAWDGDVVITPTTTTTTTEALPYPSLPERLEALPGDEAEARLGEVGGLPGLPQEFCVLVEVVLEQLRHQDQVLLYWCVVKCGGVVKRLKWGTSNVYDQSNACMHACVRTL